MHEADYLVVGAGLTGATIARSLADAGCEVRVVDRRSHAGGNVHDHRHPSGIRVHTYGPHYFRTSSDAIWRYANRFGSFYPYEAALLSWVDHDFEAWPVQAEYVRRTIGDQWRPGFTGEPVNFEEASLAMMPAPIYEKFVKGYTEKQWGRPAHELSADLAGRFEVRQDGDRRLKQSRYQGIPVGGYAAWMEAMLAGIDITLNHDYLADRDGHPARHVIFTGPIDEYFGFDLGRLAYRGQIRTHRHVGDTDWVQPAGQVNYPDPADGAHVRVLEWKHMMPPGEAERIKGTVLTTETPYSPDEPSDYEYPFPDARNQALYGRYRARADALDGVTICGRLGEYRYFDMDQAIGRALKIAERLRTATS